MAVKPLKIKPRMTVSSLVDEFRKCGVLGAGRTAKAVDILVEMCEDPDYTTFLGLAGPMVPGGLRMMISNLIDRGYVDVIVSSGANIIHDLTEALGYKPLRGITRADDSRLREEGIGRVYDIYITQDTFEALEAYVHSFMEELTKSRTRITVSELLYEIGKRLEDSQSILFKASQKGVPIFSPGFTDSIISFHLWHFNQTIGFEVDVLSDFGKLVNLTLDSKKVGAIILGGGLPKHHILAANMLRGGVDAAIQITLDRPEGGSLSGAHLEEAISWRKVKQQGKIVTLIGDATVLFPLIVSAVISRIETS